jgi:hypothetical protein
MTPANRPSAFNRRPLCVLPHVPIRPLWLCRLCAAPWPCATARLNLEAEYGDDRAGLSVYMATALHEAVEDLHKLNPEPSQDPAELFVRFIAWTQRGPG